MGDACRALLVPSDEVSIEGRTRPETDIGFEERNLSEINCSTLNFYTFESCNDSERPCGYASNGADQE